MKMDYCMLLRDTLLSTFGSILALVGTVYLASAMSPLEIHQLIF